MTKNYSTNLSIETKFYLLFLGLFMGLISYSQTVLSAGDIAFTGMNHDGNDDYSFILLKDVDAATTINFTDCGWTGSSFNCGAGDANGWTWSADAALTCGTVVTIDPVVSASPGSVSGSFALLSSIGDQILAYQGPAGSPTFISAIHSNEIAGTNDINWNGGSTTNSTSALPTGLTNGVNAIRLHIGGTESDNWQYNCAVTSGDAATISAAINNINNWVNDNGTPYSPVAPGCGWSITCVPLSTNEFSLENKITLSPNPLREDRILHINNSSQNTINSVEVFDVIGKKVFAETVATENIQFPNNIPTGLYFVKITDTKNNSITKKVMLQ